MDFVQTEAESHGKQLLVTGAATAPKTNGRRYSGYLACAATA